MASNFSMASNEELVKRLVRLSEETLERANEAESLALDLTSNLEGARLEELQGTFDKIYNSFAMGKTIAEATKELSRIAAKAILGEREAAVFFVLDKAEKECCNVDCNHYLRGTCPIENFHNKANCWKVAAAVNRLLDDQSEEQD